MYTFLSFSAPNDLSFNCPGYTQLVINVKTCIGIIVQCLRERNRYAYYIPYKAALIYAFYLKKLKSAAQ